MLAGPPSGGEQGGVVTDEARYLTRGDVAALGFPRRAVDAIFRGCPVIFIPGYSRPLVSREELERYLRENTYDGNRVRPMGVESPRQDAAGNRANGRRRLTRPPSPERRTG